MYHSPRKITRTLPFNSNNANSNVNNLPTRNWVDNWPTPYLPNQPAAKNYYAVRSFNVGVYPCWQGAKEAGQKWGPDSLWIIEGFETYEAAFAFMLGYSRQHMNPLLPAVNTANRAYLEGTYTFPTEYHVINNIPPIPGQILPPTEVSDTYGWSELRDTKGLGIGRSPSLPPSSKSVYMGTNFYPIYFPPLDQIIESFNSNTDHNSSIGGGMSSKTQSLNFSAPLMTTQPMTSRYTQDKPFASRRLTNNPIPGPSSSIPGMFSTLNIHLPRNTPVANTRFFLTPHMRRYLLSHHRFTQDETIRIDNVVGQVRHRTPGMIDQILPELARMNVSEEPARFFLGWVFDICEDDEI